MYYKSEELNKRVQELCQRKASDNSLTELAVLVYRYGDDRAKSIVMLAHIYKHVLENRFYAARDMLLMSHLQKTIAESDIPLQVMFNRAMTQLGLCAFRTGSGGGFSRMKELFAQIITQQRGCEKTPEQEEAEARRQIPYYMHFNLDFIETAHLTSTYICAIRSWKELTVSTRATIQERLKEPPKVEALRTFSLSYLSCFDSMSTEQLSTLFSLPPAKVHSVLSKMIINLEMRASWDQPTASIVMRRTEPSRLQSLALQLGSEVGNMTENNEKLMKAKNGGTDRNERNNNDRGKTGSRDGRGMKRGNPVSVECVPEMFSTSPRRVKHIS
ncbi:Translation initiation factor eIF3 subunit C [Gracilaria domingensis]|nr:Translation initiation factor eIF3 subunit C [Gracilaria domingensis]